MTTKLIPTLDRIIVEAAQEADKSEGGILLPENAKEKPQEGKVLAVGAGTYQNGSLIPVSIKAGDRVLFQKYSGIEVKENGIKFLVLRESDVLAIIKK